MPNHVATVLTIDGPIDEIKRFIAAVDNKENGHFDFGGLLPMPEELENTTSPVRIQPQEEIDAIWAEWRKNREQKADTGPQGLHIQKTSRLILGLRRKRMTS